LTSLRERVAIVFMTLSAVLTLVLGGAVVHELGTKPSSTVVGAGAGGGSGLSAPGSGGAAPGGPGSSGAVGSASSGSSGGAAAASSGSTSPGGSSGVGTTAAGSLSGASVGVTNSAITVGGIYDETGPFDATVERDTVRAYFDTVNAAGGVNGRKLQLLDCDSGYDPSRAHQCSQQLLGQNILAMVGWLSVSGEEAETQYLSQQGVPVIGGLGVPTEFSSSISWPVTDGLVTYGTAMGDHAKDLGIHAPGIVILNVNFIAPVEQSLVTSLHKNGIKEKSVDQVDATKPDYTDIALKLQSEGVDSVIAALDPFSYSRMLQAFDRQNFHPKLFGLGLDKPSANQQYGSAVYNAQSLTPLLEPADHMSQAGVAAYYGAVRKYFPNQVAALDVYSEGDWVAAEVFVDALRQIGTGAVTRQSLATALNSLKNVDTQGLTEPISYSAGNSHDPNRCFQWIQNKSGTWTTYSGWNCF